MHEEGSNSSSDDVDDDDSSWLGRARGWWAQCRHGPDMSMSEITARHAEDDFVHARQADARLTPADFHRWLTVARLLAAATGDTEIRVSHWDRMRAMESQRLDRIEKRRGPGGDLSMNAVTGRGERYVAGGVVGELRESPQSITMTS